MNTALFVRSYPNDFPWLRYSIQSMNKYLTGVESKILIVPWKTQIPDEISSFFDHVVESYLYDKYDGYIAQQFDKLDAYKYTDKDYILFSDSDCIYTGPFDISTMFDRYPILGMTPYTQLADGGGYFWKAITESLLGFPVSHEFMRCFPLLHYRDTLIDFSKDYPEIHKRVINKDISEFNLLGAYAFKKEHKYIFTEDVPQYPCKQYWSWGGLSNDIVKEIEGYLV